MTDIALIALEDLENDKVESLGDIKVCELALLHGITTYSNGKRSIEYRLKMNKKIVLSIDAELQRRQENELL